MPGPLDRALAALDREAAGRAMHDFVARALPLPRSLTGDGVRRTLELGREIVPLELHEVPSGTPVFDWTVPDEWNVRQAWIEGPDGRRVVDFADSSLHLLGYSVPVRATLDRAELDRHLFSLPEQPDLIPYRTSYYERAWGFCLPHRLRQSLPEGDYRVLIDATLEPGSLTYGELLVPGAGDQEVLISCHVCHPALANDNLSALAVTLWLARRLAAAGSDGKLRYGYRFVWIPGTIGAITWLARNEARARRIAHGLVAANLGDAGGFTYKKSRRGDAPIDRAVGHLLAASGEPHEIQEFVPFGYDERQYCSPGFDLPVGSLTRTPWGRYPEYHTSADDLELVRPASLGGSLARYLEVAALLEADRHYQSTNPKCEPQLGRRGLYGSVGGATSGRDRQLALLWMLNLADGGHSLLDVAERSGLPFARLQEAAEALAAAGLLVALDDDRSAPQEDP